MSETLRIWDVMEGPLNAEWREEDGCLKVRVVESEPIAELLERTLKSGAGLEAWRDDLESALRQLRGDEA